MESKLIEQTLRKQKDKAGMLFTKLHYKEMNKGTLNASISLNFEDIQINLNPNIWNDKIQTAKTLTEHEIGHWKMCPYDLSYHLEIVSNVIEVVKQKLPQINLSEKPMQNGFIHEITNVFEDIIDNLFIDEQNFSEIYASTSISNKGKISKDFQFALGVQLQLWGTEEDYKLLMPVIEKEPYQSATDFLKEIGINKNDSISTKRKTFGYKNDWAEQAGKFTKYYLKYYDPNDKKNKQSQNQNGNQQGQEQGQPQQGQGQGQQQEGKGNGQPQQGQGSGKGQKSEENEEGKSSGQGEGNEQKEGKGNGQGNGQDNEGNGEGQNQGKGNKEGKEENNEEPTIIIDNNPFDEDMKDINKVKRALGQIANRKGMGPAQKISRNIIKDDIISVDILLDSISPEIEIKHKKENDGYGFPLIPLTKKFIGEDDVSASILGVGVDQYGEPNLEVGKMHFPINIHGTEKAKQIPDFLYIVDDSGSMGKLSVGDKYFMAMMGLYGTKNWLAKNGHIDYVKFGLIQFSNSTRAWGFDKFEYAYKMKQLILNPEGGGTVLNIDTTKKLIHNHNKKLIIIMLSDGAINNWSSINTDFINLIRPHQFTFIGIGDLGNAGNELKGKGFNAIPVNNVSKLHEIVIDVATSSYSNF